MPGGHDATTSLSEPGVCAKPTEFYDYGRKVKAMNQDEMKNEPYDDSNSEQEMKETTSEALRKASQLEQIDDSQLPQSIKELFSK